MTPPIRMVSVPPNVLESIAFNLCSLHDFDPAFVQQNEKFALAAITEYLRAQPASDPAKAGAVSRWAQDSINKLCSGDAAMLTAAPVREEGGAVEAAVKIATDLHKAFEQLIYGLPKYLEAENLTDEENMIRDAWITLDVTAHRLAALATRADAPAELSGNPGELEAPAEAGEQTVIARAIRRAIGDAWIGEHQAEVAAEAVIALRTRPQARSGEVQ